MGLHISHIGLIILAEEGEFIMAVIIFYGHAGAGRAGLGGDALDVGHNAGHGHGGLLLVLFKFLYLIPETAYGKIGKVVYFKRIPVKRMGA